jgi:hypothetical protein
MTERTTTVGTTTKKAPAPTHREEKATPTQTAEAIVNQTVEAATGTAVTITTADAMTDYSGDAGAGFESVGTNEFLIPFVRILQSNSPQCDEASGSYNPDARPGMIINTATGQMYSGKAGLAFVPVERDHTYPEFVPRDAGGGFVSVWTAHDPRIPDLKAAQGQFGRLKLENGNELTETFSLYGLATPVNEAGEMIDKMDLIQGVIGFSSTQIKTYKMITTRLISMIGSPPRYPIWAHVWIARTVPQKNKKGSFYGWSFGLRGGNPATAILRRDDPLYQQGKALHAALKAGTVRADYEKAAAGTADSTDGADTADEYIPF